MQRQRISLCQHPACGNTTILFSVFHRALFLKHGRKDNRVARALVTLIRQRVIKGYKGTGCWLFVCRPLENAAAHRIRNTIFTAIRPGDRSFDHRTSCPTMAIRKEENIRFRIPGDRERERERERWVTGGSSRIDRPNENWITLAVDENPTWGVIFQPGSRSLSPRKNARFRQLNFNRLSLSYILYKTYYIFYIKFIIVFYFIFQCYVFPWFFRKWLPKPR